MKRRKSKTTADDIELFSEEVIQAVLKKEKFILSGDFNKCVIKDKILTEPFNTKIFFSPLPKIELPSLEKFQGYFISEHLKGVTTLEV